MTKHLDGYNRLLDRIKHHDLMHSEWAYDLQPSMCLGVWNLQPMNTNTTTRTWASWSSSSCQRHWITKTTSHKTATFLVRNFMDHNHQLFQTCFAVPCVQWFQCYPLFMQGASGKKLASRGWISAKKAFHQCGILKNLGKANICCNLSHDVYQHLDTFRQLRDTFSVT